MCVRLAVAFGLSVLASPAQEAPKPELKVAVTSGERLVHNLQDRKPQTVVVKVTGADGSPVTGAMVVFQVPPGSTAPTGAFEEAGKPEETIMLPGVTDAQGNALARGLRPNAVPGAWKINVKVTHLGTTVDIQIAQINQEACKPGYRPASPPTGFCVKPGGSGKWIALVGGGAAVAGVLAATRGGGNGGTTTIQQQPLPPAAPSGTIRLGSITIGPP